MTEDKGFRVESSGNLGGSWDLEATSDQSFHAIRLARQSSAEDCGERLFRVVNAESGAPLLHFRNGASVYESRGWR